MADDIRRRVYIYSSFFYRRLTQKQVGCVLINAIKDSSHEIRQPSGFERVKNWTSRVDLFDMDYLVIPINER
jgi:Ulp1 family protease